MKEDTLAKILEEKYESLSFEEKQRLYQLLSNDSLTQQVREQAELLLFYKRPPTPEEFLDPANGWLHENVVKGTYDHIKEQFIEIASSRNIYHKVVQYGATRLGKTYLARLLILYTIVFIHHLREPSMYYNLSPLTDLCIYLISFKFDKTRQLYLEPMYKIMRGSKKFKQVKFVDKVREEQKKLGRDVIVWSKAAEAGEITLASGLQIHLGNDDALNVIGGDILQCYISEINWFIENAGASEDSIYRLYTDIADRIEATVGKSYLAFAYLDSSANDADSLIEKHIINELQNREGVYFKWQSRWEARPYLFPTWQKTGKTFDVITGTGSIPAKIVSSPADLDGVPEDLIIKVPIDALQKFKDNLGKAIRDIAGRPSSSENKFIQDIAIINNLFNNRTLVNVEGLIYSDAASMPEELLWNQLCTKFFIADSMSHGTFRFKRAPNEVRYIGLDNAFGKSLKSDAMGLCVLHKEWSITKNAVVYVVDFCFAMKGIDSGINLEAPAYLAIDMICKGNVNLHALYADTFHSEGQKQFLERNNVKFIKQSVDTEISPYQYMLSCLINEHIKSGRNIFLKNNLQALMRKKGKNNKEKIDHNVGTLEFKYNGDWEKSQCGFYAKDVSDAVCQAVWGAFQHEYVPTTIYEEQNKNFSCEEQDIQDLKENALQILLQRQARHKVGNNVDTKSALNLLRV